MSKVAPAESLESRLTKSTADLLDLERTLISGNIDARVLRDFRDAVDYVRKAAWAVQEWQERQAKSHDTSTVLPLLMFERIRRATQLCRTIATRIGRLFQGRRHRRLVRGNGDVATAIPRRLAGIPYSDRR